MERWEMPPSTRARGGRLNEIGLLQQPLGVLFGVLGVFGVLIVLCGFYNDNKKENIDGFNIVASCDMGEPHALQKTALDLTRTKTA